MFARRAAVAGCVLAVSVALSACDDCRGGGAVPFKSDAGHDAGRDAGSPATQTFVPIEGTSLPAGTHELAIEGARIAVASGDLRAVLPFDLDADGDRDALVVVGEATMGSLAHVRRDGATFGPPRAIGSLATPETAGCVIGSASLRAVSPSWAVVTVHTTCAPPADPSAPSPSPTSPSPTVAQVTVGVWVVSLENVPRLRERFSLLDARGRAPGDTTLDVHGADHDGDGHEDLMLDVGVTLADGTTARASLPFLDRPAGLSRYPREPEATLTALAQRAKRALRRKPDDALALASQALALHGVLCREGDGPRVRIASADGVPCRASAGAGLAAAIAATVRARKGAVMPALALGALLSQDGFAPPAADRTAAERALAALPSEQGVVSRDGPTHGAPTTPRAHLSALAFLDEQTLLLRGPVASRYDLATGAISPADAQTSTDVVIRDPSGSYAVVDVHRTCDGYALGIVPASAMVDGVPVGATTMDALVVPRAPPSGARCPTLAAGVRADDGGLTVLGWAPQGALVAHGDEAWVVPLDVSGRPAGPPAALAPGTPTPAPIAAGAATTDGRAWVIASRWGIVLRELSPTARTTLLRPAGWDTAAEAPTDVAVSPSLRHVAVVRAGRVQILSRGGP